MWRAISVAVLAVFTAAPVAAGVDPGCSNEFESTFAALQKVIFENRGCTNVICHSPQGETVSGGLDLTAEVAYDELVGQRSQTADNWYRVFPGQRDRSLLYQNLAAKTLPDQFTAPLRPMPLDPLPAISSNELEALRRWIEAGAPREGTVAGTADLLDACLPPEKPIEIEPLPPPPPGEGVQIHMPRLIVKPNSEQEGCFATYYDITDQVPEQYRGENGTVRFKQVEIRQDPLSHHLIVNLYQGASAPTDPVWGEFTCHGGERDGEACDPMDVGFCGPGAGCANEFRTSIACFGQSNLPGDAQTGLAASGFTGAQKAADTVTYGNGVYNEIPMKGMIVWNSHAFNLTDEPGKLEAWINIYFAEPEEQVFPVQGIFVTDAIFKTDVPPFRADEVCHVFTFPKHAKLAELSSHMHQRGKRWRTWEGEWRCEGGPNDGAPCSPFGPDEEFETTDLCGGAQCRARRPPKAGDCNEDMQVSVNEMVLGVNIVLGNIPLNQCRRFDMDADRVVTVADLVAAVASALGSPYLDPEESLLYTNFIYNDPVVVRFDPPMELGGQRSLPGERSVTYCALYDNGYSDPDKVKKKSTSPRPPNGIPLGGPCNTPTACTAGNVGAPCSGSTPAERDASCDLPAGSGNGVCDACTLRGGVTTEDEMFLLLGWYYIDNDK